jgi:hypothetical protein
MVGKAEKQVVLFLPRNVIFELSRDEMKTADVHLFFLLLAERLRTAFRELLIDESLRSLQVTLSVKQRLRNLFKEFKEKEEACKESQEMEKKIELFLVAKKIWDYLLNQFDLAIVRTEELKRSSFTSFNKQVPHPQFFLFGVNQVTSVYPAEVAGEFQKGVVSNPFNFIIKLSDEGAKEVGTFTLEGLRENWIYIENFYMKPEKFAYLLGSIKSSRERIVYPFRVDSNFAANVSLIKSSKLMNVNLGIYSQLRSDVEKLTYLTLASHSVNEDFVEWEKLLGIFSDRRHRVEAKVRRTLEVLEELQVLEYTESDTGILFKLKKEREKGKNPLTLAFLKKRKA